jgi:hypothetical protein
MPAMIEMDEAVCAIINSQTMTLPTDYKLSIDKGRMLLPAEELDLSALGNNMPEWGNLGNLHAFHHLFQGYSKLIQTAPQ